MASPGTDAPTVATSKCCAVRPTWVSFTGAVPECSALTMAARTRFHGLLAMGCTAMSGLQTFIIIGGVIKLIPLTGVTMPFVSYGGTSLVACLCLIGLIQGVSSVNEDDLARDADLADYGGGAA